MLQVVSRRKARLPPWGRFMRSKTRMVEGTARRGLRIEIRGIVVGWRRREVGTRVKFKAGRLFGSGVEVEREVRWERMVGGETGKKGWEWMKRVLLFCGLASLVRVFVRRDQCD